MHNILLTKIFLSKIFAPAIIIYHHLSLRRNIILLSRILSINFYASEHENILLLYRHMFGTVASVSFLRSSTLFRYQSLALI